MEWRAHCCFCTLTWRNVHFAVSHNHFHGPGSSATWIIPTILSSYSCLRYRWLTNNKHMGVRSAYECKGLCATPQYRLWRFVTPHNFQKEWQNHSPNKDPAINKVGNQLMGTHCHQITFFHWGLAVGTNSTVHRDAGLTERTSMLL